MSPDWVPLKSLNLMVGSEEKFCLEWLPHSICVGPGQAHLCCLVSTASSLRVCSLLAES